MATICETIEENLLQNKCNIISLSPSTAGRKPLPKRATYPGPGQPASIRYKCKPDCICKKPSVCPPGCPCKKGTSLAPLRLIFNIFGIIVAILAIYMIVSTDSKLYLVFWICYSILRRMMLKSKRAHVKTA